MGYDGFISYSHAADGELAPALQAGLGRLAKSWNRRRALRVFRDETGLSTNPHLWSAIEAALDDSAWFVLLASPDSARSEWVNRELAHWLATKSSDRILPVVTDGTWTWDPTTHDFTQDSTAVPAALRGALGDEARHLDMRWARTESQLDLRNSRFRGAVADLAAPMHGIAKDELECEDIRQHRRTRWLVRGAAATLVVLTLVAVVAASAAIRTAGQARQARDQSDYQRVVAQSGNLKASNPELALLLAVEARRTRDTPESRGALQAALVQDPQYLGTIADATTTPPRTTGLCSIAQAHAHEVVATREDGTIKAIAVTTGRTVGEPRRLLAADRRLVASVALPRSALGCAASSDGRTLQVFSASGLVWKIDPITLRVLARRDTHDELSTIAVSPDGRMVAVGTANGKVLTWPVRDHGAAREMPSGGTSVAVAFAPDGRRLASSTGDQILLWDTTNWQPAGTINDPPSDFQSGGLVELAETLRTIAFSPDGRSLVDSRRAAIKMLDTATGTNRWTAVLNDTQGVPVAFDPRTGALFGQSSTGSFSEFDTTTGARIRTPFKNVPDALCVTRDGSMLVAGTGPGNVERWALDGNGAISHLVARPGAAPQSYSPDGRTLLTVPAIGSLVVVATDAWDTRTGFYRGSAPAAAFPQLLDAHTIAGYFLGRLAVDRLDLRSGTYVRPRFAVPIAGVATSGNDTRGRVVVAYQNGSITRYKPDGTKVGSPWLKLKRVPNAIRVSAKGLVAMSFDDNRTLVFDINTGKLAYAALQNTVNPKFSPDGSLLGTLAADTGQIEVRDAKTGKRLGAGIADAASSGYVFIQFGRNRLMALEGNESVRLYDFATRSPIGEPFATTRLANLRPDGRELATSNEQGVVLWDLDPDHWQHAACHVAGRNLTRHEWATYFPHANSYRKTCPEWFAAPK